MIEITSLEDVLVENKPYKKYQFDRPVYDRDGHLDFSDALKSKIETFASKYGFAYNPETRSVSKKNNGHEVIVTFNEKGFSVAEKADKVLTPELVKILYDSECLSLNKDNLNIVLISHVDYLNELKKRIPYVDRIKDLKKREANKKHFKTGIMEAIGDTRKLKPFFDRFKGEFNNRNESVDEFLENYSDVLIRCKLVPSKEFIKESDQLKKLELCYLILYARLK